MKNLYRIAAILLALVFAFGCEKRPVPPANEPDDPDSGKTEQGGNRYEEPVPEQLIFTKAMLVYRGDDGGTAISDEWALVMTTDGYPIGPAKVMQLDFNATYNPEQTPDISLIANTYQEQYSDGDYSVGTFNWGYMERVETPEGVIYLPSLSYFGDIADGETNFMPDLLQEGSFTIKANDDGTFTVSGVIVGNMYLKRHFSFTGTLEPTTDVEPKTPNSTLTGDIALTGFTQGRIYDRFNRFALPDPKEGDDPDMPNSNSYRYFEVYLAQPGIDLNKLVPDGNGQLLQLDILVPYGSAAADGIPAGEYTVTHRIGSGIERADIVPFRFIEGQADLFSRPAGTWLRTMDGTTWASPYARVIDGKITVERPNGGHRITVELFDCSEPAYRITGTFEFTEPLAVFE